MKRVCLEKCTQLIYLFIYVVKFQILYVSGDRSNTQFNTNRILRALLTDELASLFSFYGKRSGKKAFANFKLKSVVIGKLCFLD